MNPFNSSFSFLVDQLPPNTPLRVNIYARNNQKRSPIQVELDAKTLRAAERRIDSYSHSEGHARGRKSSFFEELYGGYGRFRSKHLVVGLLVGTVAVAIFVAVVSILISTIRSKRDECQSMDLANNGNNEQCVMADDKPTLSTNNKESGDRRMSRQSLIVKETTFSGEMIANKCSDGGGVGGGKNLYGDYGTYPGIDGDDDTSMRSDHQLIQNQIQQSHVGLSHYDQNKFYQTILKRAPPSYFDLDPSGSSSIGSGDGSVLVHDTDSDGAFVNMVNKRALLAPSSEPKPDIIQTTLYGQRDTDIHHQQTDQFEEAIFDTISFSTINSQVGATGGPTNTNTGAYNLHNINQMDPMTSGTMLVTSDQISGKSFHFFTNCLSL